MTSPAMIPPGGTAARTSSIRATASSERSSIICLNEALSPATSPARLDRSPLAASTFRRSASSACRASLTIASVVG